MNDLTTAEKAPERPSNPEGSGKQFRPLRAWPGFLLAILMLAARFGPGFSPEILKRIGKDQSPPLEIRQVELAPPQPYGDAYGVVTVAVNMDCRIEELVNFLAQVGAQPEIMSTDEVRFGASRPKEKTMPVRVTVSGLVARRLTPAKKGLPQL